MGTIDMLTSSRFEALDSWRGISAVFVVIFHFICAMPTSFESSSFLRNAYLFVDFFFVLSGFVLCHSYRGKIFHVRDMAAFALRRLARVWPLHAVVLGALVTTVAIINRYPHPQDLDLTWSRTAYAIDTILPNLLLLNAMSLQAVAWNGPAWSIGAEFYTYLLFALVLLTVRRHLITTCGCLSAVALAILFWRAPDLMNTTWDYGFIRCIGGFFAGVIAYHCYEWFDEPRILRATLMESAAILLAVSFVVLSGDGPDKVFPVSLAAPVVFAAAVVIFASERGLVSVVLRVRPLQALGRYSYSIYMVHQPLLIILCYSAWLGGYHTKVFPASSTNAWMGSIDLILVEFVLGVVLLAAAAYRFIELPARERVNRLADIRGPMFAILPRRMDRWGIGRRGSHGSGQGADGDRAPRQITASARHGRSRD